MRALGFFKKEIREIFKTNKIIVLPVIFLFFGLISPLTAKYTNELLKSLGGFEFELPAPVYTDSYAQLFSNLGQIGIIVLILTLMGIVVEEKVKGSAILVLTKSVSRTQFILSKFVSAVLLFTFSYIISVAGCLYYTYALFTQFYNENLITALAMFWLFGVFITSIVLLASTIAKSNTIAAVIGFLGFIGMSALSALPRVGKYFPSALAGLNMHILTGAEKATAALWPTATALLAIILLVAASVISFNRQEV